MIELADVITNLRTELQTAVDNAPRDGLRFELGPVELEVTVAIEKSVKAAAKVRFWVVDAESEGALGRTSTHVVKLTLQPQVGGGQSPYVSGERAARED